MCLFTILRGSATVSGCSTIKVDTSHLTHIHSKLSMHCSHSPLPFSSPDTSKLSNLHPSLLLFPSPSSSTSSSVIPWLSLRLVTCVSHSWPTCCSTQTHLSTHTWNVHTCQSHVVHERRGEGDLVFVSEHLSIFNLKPKLEECLSPGVSRTNNWQLH